MPEPKRIGLLVGAEWSWPPAFIHEVNSRNVGVVAEMAKLDAVKMDESVPYDVLIDRISHEVPMYRTYMKYAALNGCAVINNPFNWSADDKFFDAALATKLGVASPKTVLLPNKDYVPGVTSKTLRNLKYPIDWEGIIEYVGLPCVLKDAHGGGWKEVYIVHSLEELIARYDQSGLLTMVVQEFIEWDAYVRCMCIGREFVLPMRYDPRERMYDVDDEYPSPEVRQRCIEDALKLVRALGYDMNTVEFAIRDGIPYAIDFMNPAPDMDIFSLTPKYFDIVVTKMADLAIEKARSRRDHRREFFWYTEVRRVERER
nr:hypothetical protein [Ardenticatena sp.]